MQEATARAQTITAPSDHAGLVRALNACFGKAPAMPDDMRRLLDRLR